MTAFGDARSRCYICSQESGELTWRRRALGRVMSAFGTDPNRRLSDIIAGVSGLVIQQDELSLFRGQYRLLRFEKQG